MTEIESRVVEAWRRAADDLGIRFTSPFVVTTKDGSQLECVGFVHHFGRSLGTVISVLGEPSARTNYPADEAYFVSALGSGYAEYGPQWFIETLDDLQFFGPESERPSWYLV